MRKRLPVSLAVSLILLVGLLVAPRAQEPRAPEGKILVAAAEIFGDVEFARPSRGHRLRASAEIEPREFRRKWAQRCRKEGKVPS